MKIQLSSDALVALQKLQDRFRKSNELVDKASGPFLSQFVRLIEKELSDKEIERIAPLVVSDNKKRKSMKARLLKLADNIDEDRLLKLEKQFCKIALSEANGEKSTEKLEGF